ncbi:hypothetical protein Acr_28g0005700 [Actinidia rufa]|uniref:Uncharacterized protein n=1 Tax=Actinidia rufa TaxID=165716 RepID=A0A7J0HA69_9ERIC|nr:hypothetical protein Acr_28g0005700 [Actinidia rufa]
MPTASTHGYGSKALVRYVNLRWGQDGQRFSKSGIHFSVVVKIWASNQQSMLLCLLGTGPRMLEGRPAQTNRSKGPGRGRLKPLRRGDQTNVMTADGVMDRVHGSRRDPRKDRYGKISRRCRRHNREDCHLERRGGDSTLALGDLTSTLRVAYGELNGDDLARSHGLVLPRSRGFGDKQPLKKSWVRLPDEGEIITSTRPGEVAFYEAAFPAGLRFPIHPTIRYSISLTEIRNLFSLNSNPKPDQGWLYFKARNKKVLLGGYPSNVKGWKSKFFFVSGDEWEIPEGTSRKGAARVPRTWGIPDKYCNNPPRLSTATKRKSLKRFFGRSRSWDASPYPCYWNPNHFAESLSLPVLGRRRGRRAIICRAEKCRAPRAITELRRLLPHIPDLTLLRWTGGKVLDPILDHYLNIPSSNPSSESCSDSSLPVELESDAMSKRVSFKKIGEKLGKAASASSRGLPFRPRGVIIGEKRPGESITSSPSKKGKVDDGSKGKGVVIGPEGKKKKTSSGKALTPPSTASPRPGEGSSANLGTVLGPTASMLGSPSVAEKLLQGVIPPADKEKVEKLTLDQTATKLFHVIGQALMLGSSLAVAADLEQQLAESRAREQQANDELAKAKSDRDLLSDKFERSGMLANELRDALNKSKEFAVEEFKSSSEFMVAVEDSASKYFGEGFNFCKVQLRRHHPDLAIDLEGTVVDQDLLAEQDEAEEENDKEKTGEDEGGNQK